MYFYHTMIEIHKTYIVMIMLLLRKATEFGYAVHLYYTGESCLLIRNVKVSKFTKKKKTGIILKALQSRNIYINLCSKKFPTISISEAYCIFELHFYKLQCKEYKYSLNLVHSNCLQNKYNFLF